jgi:hypothetical protein
MSGSRLSFGSAIGPAMVGRMTYGKMTVCCGVICPDCHTHKPLLTPLWTSEDRNATNLHEELSATAPKEGVLGCPHRVQHHDPQVHHGGGLIGQLERQLESLAHLPRPNSSSQPLQYPPPPPGGKGRS